MFYVMFRSSINWDYILLDEKVIVDRINTINIENIEYLNLPPINKLEMTI